MQQFNNPYLAFSTANNRFNSFVIKPKRMRWVSKIALAILLIFSVSLYHLSFNVSQVMAAVNSTMYVRDDLSNITGVWLLGSSAASTSTTTTKVSIAKTVTSGNYVYAAGMTNIFTRTPGTPVPAGWLSGDANGETISTGTWSFTICEDDNGSAVAGYLRVLAFKVRAEGAGITASSLIYDSSTAFNGTDLWDNAANNNTFTSSSITGFSFDSTYPQLYVEYWNIITDNTSPSTKTSTFVAGTKGTTCSTSDPQIVFNGGVVVPEKLVFFLAAAPFIPMIVSWIKRRKERMVFNRWDKRESLL